jgi:hypothetical protein
VGVKKWFVLLLGVGAHACSPKSPNHFVFTHSGTTVDRVAKVAFAEYVELPGRRSELRLIMATYPVGCGSFHAPAGDDVLVSLTLTAPAGDAVALGRFPFTADEEELNGPPRSLPFVRGANWTREFSPAGEVTLSQFEPKLQGRVTGTFSFLETEPDEGKSQAGLRGEFNVRLCRAAPDPARNPTTQ